MLPKIKIYAPYLAWVVALASTLGSLFFSEVMHLPPCTLCWYQRILMYPLAILLPILIIKKDKYLPILVLPLSVIGLVIAAFHNLLYYGIIPEAQAPCAAGVSCTTKFFEWFGFVTIPFLSLMAFVVVIVSMIILLVKPKPAKDDSEE